MMNVIFILLLLCIFCRKTHADGIKCPDDFTQFEERCYKYIPTPATWHDARVTCLLEYSADLISLDEQAFFEHITSEFGGPFYVGATDYVQEGTFVWTNGLLVTGGWVEGEPSNGLGREHCAEIKGSGLNDVYCEYAETFICEKGDIQVTANIIRLVKGCPPGYSLYEGDCIKCPNSYIRFENKCYKYNSRQVPWYEARQSCREDGGDLVSLNEHAFFNHVALFTRIKDIGIHVGSNDFAEEGVFIWSNGEPVTNGWIEGEPNNILDDEDCVSLKNGVGFNDISCNFDYIGFICEQNVTILSTTTSSTNTISSTDNLQSTKSGNLQNTSSWTAATFSMPNRSNTMTETTTISSLNNPKNKTTKETITTHSMTSRTIKTTKTTPTTTAKSIVVNTTYKEQYASPSLSIGSSTQRTSGSTTATTDGSITATPVSSTPSTAESETQSIDTARSTSTPNVSEAFTNSTRAKLSSPITTAASTVDASTFVTNIENTTTIKTVTTSITRIPSMMTTTTTVVTTTATAITTAATTTSTAYTTAATTTTTAYTTAPTTTSTAYTTAATTTTTVTTLVPTTDANGGDSKLLLGLALSAAVLNVIFAAVSVWMILKYLKSGSRVSDA